MIPQGHTTPSATPKANAGALNPARCNANAQAEVVLRVRLAPANGRNRSYSRAREDKGDLDGADLTEIHTACYGSKSFDTSSQPSLPFHALSACWCPSRFGPLAPHFGQTP